MVQTLYVVDAHSLIFQVFYAIPEMTGPDGRPTNAVFGFCRDLLNIVENKRPDYLICAFDSSGPTFREEIYSEYKATRGPMPDDLRPQIDMIRQVIDAMRLPLLESAGFEADDIVATVAREARERSIRTFICSADKDIRELLGPMVSIYNIRKDEVFDVEALRRHWGIGPEQVVDLLAMTGDSVDNIPGIPGVGPKTAAALLGEFDTLDGVLANVERISGEKRRENIRIGTDLALTARRILKLRDDVPVTVNWDAARLGDFDAARLAELFRQFGFRRLTAEFAARSALPSSWETSYRTVTDRGEMRRVVARLADEDRFALDVQTTDPLPMRGRIIGVSLAWLPGQAAYIPVRGPAGESHLSEQEVLSALQSLLESNRHEKLGHNLKHMQVALGRAGMKLRGPTFDTMVADYLMEAGGRSHQLDQLGQRYLQHSVIPIADVLGKDHSVQQAPLLKLGPYACERADVVFRVGPLQKVKLREQGLWPLYESLEGPLIEVLAEMEFTGIGVDVPVLERLSDEFARKLAELEGRIYSLAGCQFNIASPAQLRGVLFDKLKLPVLKRTKTGPSTDQDVLEQLAREHSLPALLIEHRQNAKLKSTYVDTLPSLVHPETGRIHASFNQVVAATGRLSSSDPNLQNIPIRTEHGRQIRQAFIAGGRVHGEDRAQGRNNRAAWKLLTADYSQVELRILAHLSGDAELLRAFAEDQDIHRFVASQIYGVGPEEVTGEMRRTAKTVNFGVVYGLSPFGLASRLDIAKEDAEAFIDAYFQRYCGVEAFIARVLQEAHRNRYVATILGRRRHISGVRTSPGRTLNQSEREAVNTVVQGSAADLVKRAMINLFHRTTKEHLHSRMLLQIHDELVFEVPDDELEHMVHVVTEEMTDALELKVPLKVDIAAGPNWLDTEPIEKSEGIDRN